MLTPKDVVFGSNKTVWWKCFACGNEWKASVSARYYGRGCKICGAKKGAKKNSLNAARVNSFVKNYPDLANEWNYEKNKELDINEFSSRSNKIVWWKCSFCGYEWEASFNSRTTKQGCPNCSLVGSSFSEQAVFFYVAKEFPDAISRDKSFGKELDIYIPSIKTAIEYDGFYYHNDKKSFEKENSKDRLCKKNGIRLIRIRDPKLPDTENSERINCIDTQGKNLNKAISQLLTILRSNNKQDIDVNRDEITIKSKFRQQLKENSIAKRNPELIEEWDDEKNQKLSPETTSYGSDTKVWWICKICGYNWRATVSSRANGTGCPCCANKVVVEGKNDISTKHPELLIEWDYQKNEKSPNQVLYLTNKKYWWKCNNGHSWQASPYTRITGKGCPVCNNRQVEKGFNDLATVCPQLAKEWNYEKNNVLKPDEVVFGSNKSVWWKCSVCGNEWEAIVSSRYYGRGCPKCAKQIRAITRSATYAKANNLEKKYPEIAKQWHPSKNGDLLPSMVSSSSNKKVWWLCPICGGEWQAAPNTRTSGSGCPICAGKKVKIGFNDLATTEPELANQWHPFKNGALTPQKITRGSNKKVWWLCETCGNEWESTIHNRLAGNGCPICGIKKARKTQRIQAAKLNNLVINYPNVASEWNYEKNEEPPENYACSSNKKVWWTCHFCGKIFESQISTRTRNGDRMGCPDCKRKQRKKTDS